MDDLQIARPGQAPAGCSTVTEPSFEMATARGGRRPPGSVTTPPISLQPAMTEAIVGRPNQIARITRLGRATLLMAVVAAAVGVAFALAGVAGPVAVRSGTGAILVVLLAATGLLSAHAARHTVLP